MPTFSIRQVRLAACVTLSLSPMARAASRTPVREAGPVASLARVVDFAQRGGHVDIKTNGDLSTFIKSGSSASPMEILLLKRASGETPPDLVSEGNHKLGDRMEIEAKWVNQPVERHTGVIWNLGKSDDVSKAENKTILLVDGKNGGAPFFLTAEGSTAWWKPSSVKVQETAGAAPADEKSIEQLLQNWNALTEAGRAARLNGR